MSVTAAAVAGKIGLWLVGVIGTWAATQYMDELQANGFNFKETNDELLNMSKSETVLENMTGKLEVMPSEKTTAEKISNAYTEWLKTEEGQAYMADVQARVKANEAEADQRLANESALIKKYEDKEFEDYFGDTTTGNNGTQEPDELDKNTNISLEQIPATGPNEEIKDETSTNTGVDYTMWLDWAEQQQAKQWAREDEKQKHIEEREDNAYQRAVADMKLAGINPNLVGVNPAQAGGGIMQATGVDISAAMQSLAIKSEEFMNAINNAFKGNEAEKDRFLDIWSNILQTLGFVAVMKGKK